MSTKLNLTTVMMAVGAVALLVAAPAFGQRCGTSVYAPPPSVALRSGAITYYSEGGYVPANYPAHFVPPVRSATACGPLSAAPAYTPNVYVQPAYAPSVYAQPSCGVPAGGAIGAYDGYGRGVVVRSAPRATRRISVGKSYRTVHKRREVHRRRTVHRRRLVSHHRPGVRVLRSGHHRAGFSRGHQFGYSRYLEPRHHHRHGRRGYHRHGHRRPHHRGISFSFGYHR